jgi:hypothetical protein
MTAKGVHLSRWLWLYEFDPRIGQLISQHYIKYGGFPEAYAHLACWERGVREDEYPQDASIRKTGRGPRPPASD